MEPVEIIANCVEHDYNRTFHDTAVCILADLHRAGYLVVRPPVAKLANVYRVGDEALAEYTGQPTSVTGDCYECGDGLVLTSSGWRHSNNLGIGVDGERVLPTCQWGRPTAPGESGPPHRPRGVAPQPQR